jgi:hypothetical protein
VPSTLITLTHVLKKFSAYSSSLALALTLLLMSYLSVSAQIRAPKYSNEFLQLGVDARGFAMSGAQAAVSGDVSSGYWNPAGLAQLENRHQAALMHAEYFAGIASFDYAGFATKVDSNAVFSLSFIRFSVDNIADTRFLIVNDVIDYNRIQRFSASDNAMLFSFGRKNVFTQGLSLGGSAKVIYRNAGKFANAWGFGIDAGLRYEHGLHTFALLARDVTSTFNAWSFNASELAPVFQLTDNELPGRSIEITLPSYVLAAATRVQFLKHFAALPTVELVAFTDGKRNVPLNLGSMAVDPRAGVELSGYNLVFLRAGIYNFQQIKKFDGGKRWSNQINAGIGLRIKRFSIDYAITDLGNQAEALYSHIFSLKAGF